MEYLKIGKIINTRGIKGELKIKSATDFQEDRYAEGSKIYIYFQNNYIEFEVLKYRRINNLDILVLKDNEDINLVEKYKGCEIFVEYESEMTLMEDEYHITEIIGLDVYQNDKRIGEVYDVKAYPQGDYIDILLETEKHKLIPFRYEFVTLVDLDNNRVEIVDMEGLI